MLQKTKQNNPNNLNRKNIARVRVNILQINVIFQTIQSQFSQRYNFKTKIQLVFLIDSDSEMQLLAKNFNIISNI